MVVADRNFWLFVVPLLVGFSALGLVVLFFFFPDDLYPIGSSVHVLSTVVACGSLAVLVWRARASNGQVLGELSGE